MSKHLEMVLNSHKDCIVKLQDQVCEMRTDIEALKLSNSTMALERQPFKLEVEHSTYPTARVYQKGERLTSARSIYQALLDDQTVRIIIDSPSYLESTSTYHFHEEYGILNAMYEPVDIEGYVEGEHWEIV